MKDSLILLKEYKNKLTKQQYKTLKGQILKGDIEGFRKGLFKIVNIVTAAAVFSANLIYWEVNWILVAQSNLAFA